MGTQISIVQSLEDEKALVGWLSQRAELLCLPRMFPSPQTQPLPLGECTDLEQVFFFAGSRDEVLRRIVRLKPFSWEPPVDVDTLPFHVAPKALICIEWTRTPRHGERTYSYSHGRFYLDTQEQAVTEHAEPLRKLMRQLRQHIQKTHPRKSTGDGHPVYVGPHLASLVEAGEAELLWAGGSRMVLVEN